MRFLNISLSVVIVIFCLNLVMCWASEKVDKVRVLDIEINRKDKHIYEYLVNRSIGDMVFENKSKVAALKYYENALKGISNDFASMSRISYIYALKGIPSLSLYYGTNAMNVYNSSSKESFYVYNYVELLTALSISYSLLKNEPMAYYYLDMARNSIKDVSKYPESFRYCEKLLKEAEAIYRSTFYNLVSSTNRNALSSR